MVVLHHSGHCVPTLLPRANYLRGVVPNEGCKYLVKLWRGDPTLETL